MAKSDVGKSAHIRLRILGSWVLINPRAGPSTVQIYEGTFSLARLGGRVSEWWARSARGLISKSQKRAAMRVNCGWHRPASGRSTVQALELTNDVTTMYQFEVERSCRCDGRT